MKCGLFVALSFIVLLVDVKTTRGIFNHDCVLILEGQYNRIMVPGSKNVEDSEDSDPNDHWNPFLYWQTVNEDGTLVDRQFERDNLTEDIDILQRVQDKLGPPEWKINFENDFWARPEYFTMSNYCPTKPVRFYEFNVIYWRSMRCCHVATAYVASSPLNTLCRPHLGRITNSNLNNVIEIEDETNSLYECATKVVTKGYQAQGVQYKSNYPNNVCKAFLASDSQVVKNKDSDDTTLACILQCNRLPFIGTGGTIPDSSITHFDQCRDIGISQNAKSVSFDGNSICHIYETNIDKAISPGDAMGCYISAIGNLEKPTTNVIETPLQEKPTLQVNNMDIREFNSDDGSSTSVENVVLPQEIEQPTTPNAAGYLEKPTITSSIVPRAASPQEGVTTTDREGEQEKHPTEQPLQIKKNKNNRDVENSVLSEEKEQPTTPKAAQEKPTITSLIEADVSQSAIPEEQPKKSNKVPIVLAYVGAGGALVVVAAAFSAVWLSKLRGHAGNTGGDIASPQSDSATVDEDDGGIADLDTAREELTEVEGYV